MVSASPACSASAHERALCVSVVSHGQGVLVDRLLDDIAQLPRGTVARVLVTVNQPDDTWRPAIREIAGTDLEVLRNSAPQGFGANHNLAFAHCSEPCFAVVNPDIRLTGDPFGALVSRLKEDPRCALAVPIQLDAGGHRESFARRLPTPFSVVARRLAPSGTRGAGQDRAQWVSGAFMLWRSAAFGRLGGFDAGYFLYCEDVDICLRLQLAGLRFAVVDSVCVVHDAQRSSRGSPRYLMQHVKSLFRLWASPVFWRFVRARPQPVCPT